MRRLVPWAAIVAAVGFAVLLAVLAFHPSQRTPAADTVSSAPVVTDAPDSPIDSAATVDSPSVAPTAEPTPSWTPVVAAPPPVASSSRVVAVAPPTTAPVAQPPAAQDTSSDCPATADGYSCYPLDGACPTPGLVAYTTDGQKIICATRPAGLTWVPDVSIGGLPPGQLPPSQSAPPTPPTP